MQVLCFGGHACLIPRFPCSLPEEFQVKAFGRDLLQKGSVVRDYKEDAILSLLLF